MWEGGTLLGLEVEMGAVVEPGGVKRLDREISSIVLLLGK